jgi:hypothetical protein
MIKLKAAYDAGYYQTEADVGAQTSFPWQGRTCADCPFWLNGVCRVYAVARDGKADTCPYFDPANHAEANHIITERMNEARRSWWGRWAM